MLQLFYYRHNEHLATISIPPKKINFYELTFVLEGEIEYILDGSPHLIKKGDMIFIKPKTVRERKALQNMDYFSFNFLLTEEEYSFPPVVPEAMTPTVKLLLRSFEQIYNETPDCSDPRLSLLLECILKQLQSQKERKSEHPLVARIKRHIKERLREKITLEDIGKITFFSPSYCEQVFKKETGKSIIDYIIEERIQQAKSLLWEGGYKPRDIAESVGFTDYNYFARAFKKKTGYTPTEYAKKSIL